MIYGTKEVLSTIVQPKEEAEDSTFVFGHISHNFTFFKWPRSSNVEYYTGTNSMLDFMNEQTPAVV